MKLSKLHTVLIALSAVIGMLSCDNSQLKMKNSVDKTAQELLGNPNYQAISYSGYRGMTRDEADQPTIAELKEDMKLLSAMNIRFIRTYNVYLEAVPNLLRAIRELKEEDPNFEMYVMMGAWIDAKDAYTDSVDHTRGSKRNAKEIERAVNLANTYPDIVKIIAVGNEAMVHWQAKYYVEPAIILKWVEHLQALKKTGKLPKDLWITSSDNFASWGGGSSDYHNGDLDNLIKEVDYISMHTYPMHDTHYNPHFWGVRESEAQDTKFDKIDAAMQRSLDYATSQYQSVVDYMESLGVDKPIHIGETGWATVSNGYYGDEGSRAADEYKMALFHHLIRKWADSNKVSVFYFEAFDEQWKDAANPLGSENHFGLINLKSQAKYALWDLVDAGKFDGLTRDDKPITKTYNGDIDSLLQDVKTPPMHQKLEATQ